MVISLIVSFLFIIVGIKFSESAVQEASAAGFGCFWAIISRVIQAEIHRINDDVNNDINIS